MRMKFVTSLVVWLSLASAAPAAPVFVNGPEITHGVASGDVTSQSAVIWARASGPGVMYVEYATDPEFLHPKRIIGGQATEATDFTVTVKLTSLKPGTLYHYRVWFASRGGSSKETIESGTFRTAPERDKSYPLRFVWGSDLGGQKYCRRVDKGYAIFSRMAELKPDFFVANGDMIYADGTCPAEGPDGWQNIPGDFPNVADPTVDWTDLEQVREVIRQHWRYNLADAAYQDFRRHTPVYAQWDDHEVINDFGALWTYWNPSNADRAGYPNLVTAGRDALFEFNPIDRNRQDPNRIYRKFHWGKDLDLFIADARSYRSRNDLPDTPENQKTLLGGEQLAWLKKELLESKATWKVVSIDVPLSIPTGSNASVNGRDAWANGTAPDYSSQTGFERELMDLVYFLDEKRIRNVVFITTDVHFAQVIRYEVDPNGDRDKLIFHELVSGPLNAVRGQPVALDPTLNPMSLYAEGGFFNFGAVQIACQADGMVHLKAAIYGEDGLPRPGSHLDLTPQ